LRGNHFEDCGANGEAKTRRKGMKYAIIESGGKQYKAVEGSTIEVDLLPLEPGKNVNLESVLLLVDGEDVKVGSPLVAGASVKAKVVEHFKGEKTVNFQYSPKKRIRTKTGHRQSYTRLSVEKIAGK
jgi:large subunit ribosomal protein L21